MSTVCKSLIYGDFSDFRILSLRPFQKSSNSLIFLAIWGFSYFSMCQKLSKIINNFQYFGCQIDVKKSGRFPLRSYFMFSRILRWLGGVVLIREFPKPHTLPYRRLPFPFLPTLLFGRMSCCCICVSKRLRLRSFFVLSVLWAVLPLNNGIIPTSFYCLCLCKDFSLIIVECTNCNFSTFELQCKICKFHFSSINSGLS